MKAKLLKGYSIDESTSLVAGTEIEVVTGYCTCNGYDYECDINGRRVVISSEYLQITDLTPHIDWEQRRYELAKEAMTAVMCNDNFLDLVIDVESERGNRDILKAASVAAVAYADALIEELKKEDNK